MKRLLIIVFLFVGSNIYAQDAVLSEQDGIVLTQKLSKLQDGEKKDTYLLSVKATNKNSYDVFYQGPKNGVNPFFFEVTIRNLNDYIYLIASESKLMTLDGKLFFIKAGGTVSGEKEFKIAKGVTPIVTSKFLNELKQISEFR
jgi:hypothetical protein